MKMEVWQGVEAMSKGRKRNPRHGLEIDEEIPATVVLKKDSMRKDPLLPPL